MDHNQFLFFCILIGYSRWRGNKAQLYSIIIATFLTAKIDFDPWNLTAGELMFVCLLFVRVIRTT